MNYLALRAAIVETCAETYWTEAVHQAKDELEQDGDLVESHAGDLAAGYTYDQFMAAEDAGMFHTIPNEARQVAVELLNRFDKYNHTILAAVLCCMDKYEYASAYHTKDFAHYLTMEAMGHGVGLYDFSYNHFRGVTELEELFEKINTPHCEAYSLADLVYSRVVAFAALDEQQEIDDDDTDDA